MRRVLSTFIPGLSAAAIALMLAASPAWADRTIESIEDAYRVLAELPEDLTLAEKGALRDQIVPAREADPENLRWMLAEAMLGLETQQLRTVKPLAERVVAEEPTNALAHYTYGMLVKETAEDVPQSRRGLETSKARDHFHEAIRLDPALYPARKQLITYYSQAPDFAGGDLGHARRLSRAMLEIDGQAHLGHYHMGLIEVTDQRWPDMDFHFEQATNLAPDEEFRKRAVFGRTWAHFEHRKDYEIAVMIARFCADGPYADDFRFHFISAECLRNLGDHEMAMVYYAQVMELTETAPLSVLGTARCLEALGRPAEALAMYQRYLDEYGVVSETDAPGLEAQAAVERLGG